MRCLRTAAVVILASAGLSHCTTEPCDCVPASVPAVVVGRVLGGQSSPLQGARVRAYSTAGSGCHSIDTDFGSVDTEADGSFGMPLTTLVLLDSVCVFVFARPPVGASGLEDSDTTLLVMDFRGEGTVDSAGVELVLHSLP